jgi:hypothetical protein
MRPVGPFAPKMTIHMLFLFSIPLVENFGESQVGLSFGFLLCLGLAHDEADHHPDNVFVQRYPRDLHVWNLHISSNMHSVQRYPLHRQAA